MIDPKKVRLMTKLAVYEEGPGKKDLRINGYSKRTYVNIKQLESVLFWHLHRYYVTRIELSLSKVYCSCSDSLRYYSCSGYCMYKAILYQSL